MIILIGGDDGRRMVIMVGEGVSGDNDKRMVITLIGGGNGMGWCWW